MLPACGLPLDLPTGDGISDRLVVCAWLFKMSKFHRHAHRSPVSRLWQLWSRFQFSSVHRRRAVSAMACKVNALKPHRLFRIVLKRDCSIAFEPADFGLTVARPFGNKARAFFGQSFVFARASDPPACVILFVCATGPVALSIIFWF